MIYEEFFKFREEPFGVTPNPRFLYMSKKHEEAIAHLNFSVSENRGFAMLTGEVGSGKTTLIRYLLDNLGSDTHTSLIINPMVDPLELLKLINHDFGVICNGNTQKDHLEALNDFLLDSFSKNEKAVLVIDEAQEMSVECFEFTRLLSNLETNSKKLLQVILVGQPELEKIVLSAPLKQLDQRIAVRYHLEALDFNDIIIYINHRLKIAGGGMVTFPAKGVKAIYKYSSGIPRLINLACDRTLLLSYSEGKIKIDANTVKHAIREVSSTANAERRNFIKPAIAGAGILILVLALAYSRLSHDENYLDKINSAFKGIKKEGEFFINDGIYMVTKHELFETACMLNLLNIWDEKDIRGDMNVNKEIMERGYSVYKMGSDLDKAVKFNVPCILHMRNDDRKTGKEFSARCVVLRWVVGKDTMLMDPLEGKNIVPVDSFKDSIDSISLIYKNKYADSDRIAVLQKELGERGLYKGVENGVLGPKTRAALTKFQAMKGLGKTGTLDDETMIMLSYNEGMPGLMP